MMFNLHDFGYFESVLYNVQLVNTQPGIIDLRCHFSWTYQLWIYQQWSLLLKSNFLRNCHRVQRFPLQIAKTIPIEKKILNLMPAEKTETLEEHIIKKKS